MCKEIDVLIGDRKLDGKFLGRRLVIILILLSISGCVSQSEKQTKQTLEVQPIIDYSPLGGYVGEGGEALYALAGDVNAVKEELKNLIEGRSTPKSTFSKTENMNLVVFRGVFRTGGYGIKVDKVERVGNTFAVHAIYTEPGKGMMVTQAFIQPTAIIPIGKLSRGSYEAKLKVTRIVKEEGGDKIIEEDKEHASISFEVK